jgi:hypothetical protein
VHEAIQIFALSGIDDANAFQGDIQAHGGFLDLGAIPKQDGDAEPQGIELARRLQHPRFGSLGEHDPFGMPLELFDYVPDKSHGT